jgi:hypothetical protein
MARKEGTLSIEPDREKIKQAVAALKGHTRPKKGNERICKWDEKGNKLVFKDGGAKRIKSRKAAEHYAEKNGYTLEQE